MVATSASCRPITDMSAGICSRASCNTIIAPAALTSVAARPAGRGGGGGIAGEGFAGIEAARASGQMGDAPMPERHQMIDGDFGRRPAVQDDAVRSAGQLAV